jgi:hypothetical protein
MKYVSHHIIIGACSICVDQCSHELIAVHPLSCHPRSSTFVDRHLAMYLRTHGFS